MITLFALFFGALVISVAMTPISKWLAPHIGMMAMPRVRDIHTRPVPRMGGVSIFLAVMAMSVLLRDRAEFVQLTAMLMAAAMMSFLGLVDDRFSLSAYIRLVIQLGAALFAWYAGVRTQLFNTPALDAALTVLWIVGITNAMNFLDNMDGLLAGICAVVSSFFLVLAILNGQYLVSLLSAAVLGACVGFLMWNLNPANVFMGDSGSMFLGFLLACVAIKLRFVGQTTLVSWLVPVIVLALPIFDMTLVFVSRLRRGKNPLTTPGKDHSSHRIASHGFTNREAVLILYLVCGALGIIAIIASKSDLLANAIIAITLLAVAIFALWFMEFGPWKLKHIDWDATRPSQNNPPHDPREPRNDKIGASRSSA